MKRYVAITGATGGIGSALARRCLKEEEVAGVAAVYRDRDKWDAMFGREQKEHTGRLFAVEAGPQAYRAGLERMLAQAGDGTELILAMAAFTIRPIQAVERITEEELAGNLYANLELPVLQLQETVRVCREQGAKLKVVYLSSGAAKRPIKGWGLYGAAKSYMGMLLRTLSLEEGIPAAAVDPGVVDTGMQEQIRSTPETICDQVQVFRDYQAHGRLHSPEEVADFLVLRYILSWQAERFEEAYRASVKTAFSHANLRTSANSQDME